MGGCYIKLNKYNLLIVFILVLFLLSLTAVSAKDTNDTKILNDNKDGTVLNSNNQVQKELKSEVINNTDKLAFTSGQAQDELKDCNNEIINQSHEIELTGMGGGEPQLLTNNIDDSNENQTIFTTLKSQENASSNLLSSSNEDILGASIDVTTYSALRSAIGNNAYSLINIKNNLVSDGSVININRNNFVIDGNGYTIDGNNRNSRIFYGTGRSSITLKNINIINTLYSISSSTSQNGGAIFFSASNNILIYNCNFTNNNLAGSPSRGVALCFVGDSGVGCSNINVSNCNFIKCHGNAYGGAIYWNTCNGVIYSCNFINNTNNQGTADQQGAALYLANTYVSIDNCNFINNIAKDHGGALLLVFVNGTITNCNFTNNKAIERTGGAIHGNTLTKFKIDNCIFINNSAPNGGGIVFYNKFIDVNITNSFFKNNTASQNGGAIGIEAKNCLRTLIENCTIIDSSAFDGAAIYINSVDTMMRNCSFVNNSASHWGGAIYSNATDSTVDSCSFSNNSASNYNHFYQGQPITFINTYFPEVWVGEDTSVGDALGPLSVGNFNTAMNFLTDGGIMYIVGSLSNFKNHEVTRGITIKAYDRNSKIDLASGGRAFRISASNVSICDLTFQNSHISGSGGVLYLDANNTQVNNCTFYNNHPSGTYDCGGAIFVSEKGINGSVVDCTFIQNTVDYIGGAIYWKGVNGCVINSTFINCSSKSSSNGGGAICWDGVNGSVFNSTFINNTAKSMGGAIYWFGADARVFNCKFFNNKASSYGAISYSGKNITVINSTFINNTAKSMGGALGGWQNGVCIINSSFINNTALNGGAINAVNGTVINSSFINNTALRGGAIYHRGIWSFINSKFLDNKANSSGLYVQIGQYGSIFILTGYEVYINALYTEDSGSNINFDNVTFWNGSIVTGSNPPWTSAAAGINITLEIYDADNNLVDNITRMTNTTGRMYYDYSKLASGFYRYNAYHKEDRYYTFINTTGELTVNKNDTYELKIIVTPGHVGENTIVNVTVPNDVVGDVIVTINGTEYPVINIIGGKGSVIIPPLSLGNYNATVKVINDSKYENKISNETIFTILKALNSDDVNVTIVPGKGNALVNVSAPKDFTGNVSVIIDNKSYPIEIINGNGSKVIPLIPGDHNITGTNITGNPIYDDTFIPKSVNTTFNVDYVDLNPDDINITIIPDKGNVTVNVSAPKDFTGNVSVVIDNKNYPVEVINGTGSSVIPLVPGDHNISGVNITGNPIYNDTFIPRTGNTTFDVDKEILNPDDIVVNVIPGKCNVTVNVSAPKDFTGNVSVIIDNVSYPISVVNGTSSSVIPLTPGNHNIAGVNITNNSIYNDTFIPKDETIGVDKKTLDPDNIIVNVTPGKGNASVNVTAPKEFNGYVNVVIDNKNYPIEVINGTGLKVISLPAGNHNITGTNITGNPIYDDIFIPKTGNTTFNVDYVDLNPSDINVTITPGKGSVIVNVTAPKDFTGNISVIIDNKSYPVEVVNGTGSSVIPLMPGDHNITGVNITGNPIYNDTFIPITGNTTFDVDKETLGPDDIVVNVIPGKESVVVNVTTPKDFSGNISVVIDNVSYPISVVNGTGSSVIPLSPGNHSIMGVNITNDPRYNDTFIPQNISFDVESSDPQPNCFIKNNKNMKVFYKEGKKFTVRIVDNNGKPISGKSVTFKVKGLKFTTISDKQGYASWKIDFKPGKYKIITSCDGLSVSNKIRVKNVIHVAKEIKVKKSKKVNKFKIALWAIKQKIVKNPKFVYTGDKKVSLKVGKKLAGKKVDIKFKGEYFKGKVKSNGKVVIKINKTLAKELKLKKGKKYKARVVYRDIDIIYKNKPVNVKIAGKTYKVKTDKKGISIFKINKKMIKKLKVGKKYPCYISFGEDSIKRKLVIKK